jgi:hypothetical protein
MYIDYGIENKIEYLLDVILKEVSYIHVKHRLQ